MSKIEKELPIGFYSKKHFVSFIIYGIVCFIIDAIIAITIALNDVDGWVNLLNIMILLIQLIVGIGWLPFPIYFVEKRFNKKRDYEKLRSSFEKYMSNNLNRESKNFVRLVLFRYSIVFDLPYATKILKDIHLPERNTETYQVAYYQSIFEYHIANGSHTKARNILEAMAQHRVPRNVYNKYAVLYSIYMKNEVAESELVVFNHVSKDFLERMISQFALSLYAKTNNDKEKYELYKKHINKACQNNPYFRQLTR
jgi:hypothetical protein